MLNWIVWNVTYGQNIQMHKTFIRIGIRKTRNTDVFLGTCTKLWLPSLSLGFWHEERDTQFFYTECSSIVSFQLTDSTLQSKNSLASPRSEINKLRLSPNLNSLLLFKITKNPSPPLPGMTSFTSPVPFPIGFFYCDICDCHILPAN